MHPRLTGSSFRKSSPLYLMLDPDTRRALVCVRYGIGDVVMELPVLRALRSRLPRTHLTALAAYPAVQLLEGTELFDEVVDLKVWGFEHRWDELPGAATTVIETWLDRQRFDLLLNAHHMPPQLATILWARGIECLESSEEAERQAILSGEDAGAAIKEGVRRGWGLEVADDSLPRIDPSVERLSRAEDFLTARGLGSSPPIGICPVASSPLKRWPTDRMAALADYLVQELGSPALIFAGPQTKIGEELREMMRCGSSAEVVGPLHLLDIAALLSRCRVVVSNDTGVMHIAAAVGAPTLGIFGPTRSSIYKPPGDHVASAAPLNCACPQRRTGSLHPPRCITKGNCFIDAPCILGTELEDVARNLVRLLANSAFSGATQAGSAAY